MQTAAAEGHKEIVIELLKRGADVNACTTNENFPGGTALQAACEAGKVDIVKVLLEHNVNPDLGPGLQTCPLIAATERGEDKIVELLVEAHAQVNVFGGFDGSTPLIKAALFLPKESAEILIKAGAEINTPDNEGDTALIAAAYSGDQGCVEYLLSEGADIMLSNKEGLNAIQTAVKHENDECLLSLINHASAIFSAISTAIESGNSGIADIVRSVQYVKKEPDRRGSNASFTPNDDAALLTSSMHENGENDDDQVTRTAETDRPQPTGLNSVLDQSSELPGIAESQRIGFPPTTFAELGVSNWFQEPSSNFRSSQPAQQWTPQTEAPSTAQLRIKRKPSPATSNLGQLPQDSSPARQDHSAYQPENPISPPEQQNAP